eukprot:327534-Chlamydomonas_euryale.AAC.1
MRAFWRRCRSTAWRAPRQGARRWWAHCSSATRGRRRGAGALAHATAAAAGAAAGGGEEVGGVPCTDAEAATCAELLRLTYWHVAVMRRDAARETKR